MFVVGYKVSDHGDLQFETTTKDPPSFNIKGPRTIGAAVNKVLCDQFKICRKITFCGSFLNLKAYKCEADLLCKPLNHKPGLLKRPFPANEPVFKILIDIKLAVVYHIMLRNHLKSHLCDI